MFGNIFDNGWCYVWMVIDIGVVESDGMVVIGIEDDGVGLFDVVIDVVLVFGL